jgi:hypothetical protein
VNVNFLPGFVSLVLDRCHSLFRLSASTALCQVNHAVGAFHNYI